MRIIQSANPRPLNLLAVGANGLVAAASATFGAGRDVEVWDTRIGPPQLHYLIPYGEPVALAFTPDERFLLIGERGRTITVLTVASWVSAPGPRISVSVPRFALSADGSRLLVVGILGAVECVSVGTGGVFHQLWLDGPHPPTRFNAPTLTFDGHHAANAVYGQLAAGHPTQHISLRDADTGAERASIPLDPASPVQQLAFSADGAKLLVRTDARTVAMFDAATGAAAGELVHRGRPYVTGIAVHPRGPVACARTNGTVTLWDIDRREPLRTLDWKAGRLVSVAFSPDGALAAAGTEDGKVIVWDVDE